MTLKNLTLYVNIDSKECSLKDFTQMNPHKNMGSHGKHVSLVKIKYVDMCKSQYSCF